MLKHPKTFRLAPSLVERLEAFARRERRSRTAVVEAALDRYLSVAEGGATGSFDREPEGDASPPPALSSATDGLAMWLADRTGQPRALCARWVESGRVTVGGELCVGPALPEGEVRLDGEVVGGP